MVFQQCFDEQMIDSSSETLRASHSSVSMSSDGSSSQMHSHPTSPAMVAPPVKKACDACHRRKVRCTGGQPCKNCGQANLQCTYLAIPQKKGPKGSRAKVISEIRDTQQQRQHHQQLSQSSPQSNLSLLSPTQQSQLKDDCNPFDFNTTPVSPRYYSTPGLLSRRTVETCLTFFFDHLYPTYPIFSQSQILEVVESNESEQSEGYCLIASLCAFIMIQPGMTLSVSGALGESYEGEPPQNRYGFASMLIEDVLRVRKGFDYVDDPTLVSVQISFFLYSSYFTLEKQNSCWFHLREAATLAQMLSMHDETSYHTGDTLENVYKRRTFWLLLLTERAYALERHRPLSLHPTIDLPVAEGPEQEIISGFLYLTSLFRCLDDEFMGLWNKVKSNCSTEWLSALQQRLYEAVPVVLNTTESQAADIKITQQWLRVMVWQLSITHGSLSSHSTNSAMTFKYPIQVARDLIKDLSHLSLASMEVHGVGLVRTSPTVRSIQLTLDQIEKLFDVACTLTDVIACVPLDPLTSSHEQPTEYLNQFLNLISRLRGGASRYLPLLLAKVSDNLPSMTAPIHHMPLSMIKQGYAGASDGIPTPMMPSDRSSFSSFGLQAPTSYAQSGHDRALMFDSYSPSA